MGELDHGRLRALTRVTRRLSYATSVEQALREGLTGTRSLLGAEQSRVLLEEAGLYRPYELHGTNTHSSEPLTEGELEDHLRAELGEGLIVAPLISRKEVVGVLAASRPGLESAGDAEWLLASLADNVAAAIDLCLVEDEQEAEHQVLLEQERMIDDQQFAVESLCHDLRSPISTLLLGTETLASGDLGELTPAAERWIKRLAAASKKIQELTRSARETTRILTGQIEGAVEDVQVDAVLRASLDRLGPVLSGNDMQLFPEVVPATVLGNAARLGQIFDNLLGNAVKHGTEGGRVQVTMALEDGAVVVTVQNEGAAIAPEYAERIFEPYFRPPTAEGKAPGSGLGLALARALARSMQGEVQLTLTASPIAFELRLPVAQEDQGSAA